MTERAMVSRRVRRTSKEVEAAAREMRREPTPAEAMLWEGLRAHRLGGYHFRRQHAVGRFVLDFYCAAKRICVEVDGPIHDEQRERDAERDAVLAAYSIEVVRIANHDVLSNLASVLTRLHEIVDSR
jgi:very-short-patch-repair endonuclease